MAISVGKIGPKIRPATTTSAQVSVGDRLNTIPRVNAMHKAASTVTSSVSAPSGNVSAVSNREPVKVSQNTDSKVAARPSLTPLSVISVVAQAATDASIGTWTEERQAAQPHDRIGEQDAQPAAHGLRGRASLAFASPLPVP